MYMNTKISKWGNSLAMRLPKELVADLNLVSGTFVSLTKKGDIFEIKADILQNKKEYKYKLEDLLKGVTKKNIHPETDWGIDIGKEIW